MRTEIIKTRGYNSDIAADELSLKIASYPVTARYLTQRLKGKGSVVCELCCGIGVSLIELASVFQKVIGIDNSQSIIDDCHKNLEHAGVANYELLCGDVSSPDLLAKLKADVALYDIPYWSSHAGKVDPDKQNPDLTELVANIRQLLTDKIVIYAPTHMTYAEVEPLVGSCEFVKVYVNGKHDRNFIFLGSLAEQDGETVVEL